MYSSKGGQMYKTHSDENNSQIFESKIQTKKVDNIIVFFHKRDQLPTLNLPDKHLILIYNESKDIMDGDIQMNFFCKSISFVSQDTWLDILNHKKKIIVDDKTSFSTEIFTSTIRHLSENMQDCIQAASISLELELIPKDKEVLVMSGTGRYLDTLVLIEPAPLSKIHLSKIKEVLCEPETVL